MSQVLPVSAFGPALAKRILAFLPHDAANRLQQYAKHLIQHERRTGKSGPLRHLETTTCWFAERRGKGQAANFAALIALRCERFGSKMFSRLAKLISRLDHFASGEIMSWRRRPTLEARDMKESKIPAIPIKSTFWLNIGNSTTDIRVLPSTSLSWIVAINSVGCENGSEDCQDSRGQFYNPETAAAPLGNVGMGSSTLQEPSINASLVSDYVSFPESLKNIHAVSQAIANIGQIEYWVGLFPLNPRTNSVSAISNKYPSLLQTLKNQSQIPSLSWGYTAGANYKSSKVYGSLTLGGYDSSRFDNTTKVEGAFTDDPAQDFTVSLVSITTPTFDLLTAQPTTTVIDSTLPSSV
ncbi:hypothetical protein BC567DRAFT_213585 [Phyllosticta citribraziliensis]